MASVELVIFDLDNTIWDFETNSKDALVELYHGIKTDHGLDHEFDFFHSNYVEINYKCWSDYEKGLINKHQLRYGRFYDAFARTNFHDRRIIDGVADRYVEISRTKTVVFDGTYEILEYLSKKYKLAIITNGFSEVVEHKMRNCKLDAYFSHVQTSEDAGVQKPHVKIFELVMQKFSALPSQSIMVGDNLETDIAGGKNAGMRTILFDPKNQHVNYSDVKINNLTELTKHL